MKHFSYFAYDFNLYTESVKFNKHDQSRHENAERERKGIEKRPLSRTRNHSCSGSGL